MPCCKQDPDPLTLGLQKPANAQRSCVSCGRTESPQWRRGPDGNFTLCNACGLSYAGLTEKKRDDSTPPSAIDYSSRTARFKSESTSVTQSCSDARLPATLTIHLSHFGRPSNHYRKHRCPACNASFVYKKDLARHTHACHRKDNRFFGNHRSCTACVAGFAGEADLEQHRKDQHAWDAPRDTPVSSDRSSRRWSTS